MSKPIVQECTKTATKKYKSVQDWEMVLRDGEQTIGALQARIRQIKRGLRIIREKIANKEPLPDYLRERSDGQNASTHT